MANQAPFAPFLGHAAPQQQPQQQQPAPYYQPQPVPAPTPPLYQPHPARQIDPRREAIGECAQCGGTMYRGEDARDNYPGQADTSDRSGQMIVVPGPKSKDGHCITHFKCALEYIADQHPDELDEFLGDMVPEYADNVLLEFLNGWGVADFSELEDILIAAGKRNPDAEMDRRMEDRMNGSG